MPKKFIELTIVISVTVIILIFILNWAIEPIIHSRKEVVVPDIVGKSLQEALNIVSSLGLGLLKESEEFNSQLPPGTVIRQNPASNMKVREGKIIKITLSKGSELVFVPEIIGQSAKIAALTIRRSHLSVGKKEEMYSLKFSKDTVISQSPPPGEVVDKNTPVDFTISLGSPPEGIILMPDFTGKTEIEAREWFEKNNLNFELEEQFSEKMPANIIIAQSPPVDTLLDNSIPIKLTISRSNLSTPSLQEFFYYELPKSTKEQNIKILLLDETGEKEIYSGIESGGKKLQIPISKKGKAKVRVFINNILVEEKEL